MSRTTKTRGSEYTDREGDTFPLRPERPTKARNQPGGMATSAKGPIANFKGLIKMKGGKRENPTMAHTLRFT